MTLRWKGRKMVDVSKGVRDLLDLVTVLQNDVTRKDAEITRLRAELAIARREGMENVAKDEPFS